MKSKDILTKANIYDKSDQFIMNLNLNTSKFKSLQEHQYVLIIQSTTENFVKLIGYPINKTKIIKISLYDSDVPENDLNTLMKILHDHEIIHTSGLCMDTKENILFECYVNLNFSDKKSENLKTSLDFIRNKFNKIIMEEIGWES